MVEIEFVSMVIICKFKSWLEKNKKFYIRPEATWFITHTKVGLSTSIFLAFRVETDKM